MTVVARLEAILHANTEQFDRAMDKSEGRMHKVGKVAGVAGLAIAGGLAYGLEKSVKAAMESETSTARLETAFKTSGLSAQTYAKQVDALESSSRKLGFTDAQTKDALGSLLIATHNMRKASRDLSVAQDVARFKHVGLTDATKMLTMAMAGSQRAAKQLGISVPTVTTAYDHLSKNATAAEKAHAKFIDKQATGEAVIDAVSKKLHGQAQAFAGTAAGGAEQFRAQMDHLEVTLGKALLPALTKVAEKLASFMDFLSKHPNLAKGLAIGIGLFALALGGLSIASTIAASTMSAFWIAATGGLIVVIPALIVGIALLVKNWDKVTAAFGRALDWVKQNWPILVGILTGGIGFAVAEFIKHRNTIVRIFTELPGKIWSGFTAAWRAVVAFGAWVLDHVVTPVSNKLDDVVGFFKGLPGRLWTGFKAEWAAVVDAASFFHDHIIQPLVNVFNNAGKEIKGAITGLFGKVIGWAKSALGIASPSSVFHDIGQNAIKGFINGVGSMAGALKHAVVGIAKHAASSIVHAAGGVIPKFGIEGKSLPGEHASGSAQKYLIPWANQEGIAVTSVDTGTHVAGSYHYQDRAIDVAGSSGAMRKFFLDSIKHFGVGNITELFYDPMGYYVKNGATRFGAIGGHSDHVHIALDQGGWLPTGTNLITNNTGRPERVISGNGDNIVIPVSIGGEHVATVIFDQLRRKAKVFENRNGRAAFGGA